MEPRRIPQLDGVRGIAILQVLIWHYQPRVEPGSTLAYFMRLFYLTWSGVDLFFVLSGFLIGGILIDNRESKHYFASFYIRRSCRILPIYLLILLIGYLSATFGDHPLGDERSVKIISWLWYLSFTQNIWMSLREWGEAWSLWFGQTWSLAVEEQFYLLLPLTIWLVSKRMLPLCLIALISAAPFLRYLCFLLFPEGQAAIITHVLLPCRMDALAIGVLIAIGVRDQSILSWLSRNLRFLYLLLIMLGALAGTFVLRSWGLGSLFMQTTGLSVLAFLYGCLLLIALIESRGPIKWLTSLTLCRQLGIWAYCIYLVHDRFPRVFFQAYGVSWQVFAMSVAAMLVVAHLSWRYFERPMIGLGHRWKYAATDRA